MRRVKGLGERIEEAEALVESKSTSTYEDEFGVIYQVGPELELRREFRDFAADAWLMRTTRRAPFSMSEPFAFAMSSNDVIHLFEGLDRHALEWLFEAPPIVLDRANRIASTLGLRVVTSDSDPAVFDDELYPKSLIVRQGRVTPGHFFISGPGFSAMNNAFHLASNSDTTLGVDDWEVTRRLATSSKVDPFDTRTWPARVAINLPGDEMERLVILMSKAETSATPPQPFPESFVGPIVPLTESFLDEIRKEGDSFTEEEISAVPNYLRAIGFAGTPSSPDASAVVTETKEPDVPKKSPTQDERRSSPTSLQEFVRKASSALPRVTRWPSMLGTSIAPAS